MSKHHALALTAILLAGLFASALASKIARPAPQKYGSHTVPPQESSHPYHPSLDDVYYSTDVPRDIPDGPNGVATSILTILDDVLITDLNVMVTITHPWIRDLRISLMHDTFEVALLDLFPGNNAQNMTDTWFDDEAAVRIDSGAPPFTGRFRPLDSLSVFDGLSAQGTWTLRVVDQFHLDTGRVEAWAVEINRVQTLRGTVREQQTQTPISLVHVTVQPEGESVFTDASGRYGFDVLPAGTHSLQLTKACFDTVHIEGVVTTEGGETVIDTSLAAGMVESVDFVSQAFPVPIPDNSPSGASMNLSVSSDAIICDLDVTVNVTHTYAGDLELWLVSPVQDTVQLVFIGDSCRDLGANFTDCRFDDEAAQSFSEGTAPFTGSWRPYGLLVRFDGVSSQGTWQLHVVDNCEFDTGTIDSFSLNVLAPTELGANESPPPMPGAFSFYGNYPNPFNTSTEFRFSISRESAVELVLYDIAGRRAATILNGIESAGEHSVHFDATNLPSGIYIARLSALGQFQSRKLVLLK